MIVFICAMLILCTATQCESASDPELNAVVGAAELASALGLTFVVLDASPVAAVAEALSNARKYREEDTLLSLHATLEEGKMLTAAETERLTRLAEEGVKD